MSLLFRKLEMLGMACIYSLLCTQLKGQLKKFQLNRVDQVHHCCTFILPIKYKFVSGLICIFSDKLSLYGIGPC